MVDLNKKYDIQIAWTGFHPHCNTFENIPLSYLIYISYNDQIINPLTGIN